MRVVLCIGLALTSATLFALASACGNGDQHAELAATNAADNPDSDTPPPSNEQGQTTGTEQFSPEEALWREWVMQSPVRQTMQRMWINCGLITGNGSDVPGAEFEIVVDASEYIRRRAAEFAEYWRVIRDENKATVTAAIEGDWDEALASIDRAHSACGTCHYDYWPPAARGYIPETLRRWEKDQSVIAGAPWGPQVFTAPKEFGQLMRRIQQQMNSVYIAIGEEDRDETKAATLVFHKTVNSQLSFWESIEENARKISEAAEKGDRSAIEKHYNIVTLQCRACHAAYSGGKGLDPLPWPRLGD